MPLYIKHIECHSSSSYRGEQTLTIEAFVTGKHASDEISQLFLMLNTADAVVIRPEGSLVQDQFENDAWEL